ncbi:hypothetical protein ACN9MF_24340 [Methylobacterium fujisawaense]|uniref:hypothetical protein n=1 Tax=Methylobacterium fujisawaense TaxID=107400 RepID=UPI003CF454C1
MIEERAGSRKMLQRIAAALGDDVAIFHDEPVNVSSVGEALELLTAFESVFDRDDRRACIDFVRSVAARQRNDSE